jgi:hypothetical protein
MFLFFFPISLTRTVTHFLPHLSQPYNHTHATAVTELKGENVALAKVDVMEASDLSQQYEV